MRIRVNGNSIEVQEGTSLAAALENAGLTLFRRSVKGEPRGPLCGMGICFECRVAVDGVAHTKACQVQVRDGMEVICG